MKILFVILGVLLLSVIPYMLGCSNGAILVSRFILRDDIRHHGSGNAGLTNFYRTFGGGLTFLVILADVLKAVFALLLGMLGAYLLRRTGIDAVSALRAKYISGLFCELGHMFPVTFGFKGGKGIMSGGIMAGGRGGLGCLPDPGHCDEICISGVRIHGDPVPDHGLDPLAGLAVPAVRHPDRRADRVPAPE